MEACSVPGPAYTIMPNQKVRSRTAGRRKSARISKPFKPSSAILNVVSSLQALVEHHEAWDVDHEDQLLHKLEQLLSKLRALQESDEECVIPTRTTESFNTFSRWLSSNGLNLDDMPYRIDFIPGSEVKDATLFATRDIENDEVIMSVPSTVLFSADKSPIKVLEDIMPALRTMPSLALALHLLSEASKPGSHFRPYIDTLPSIFTTPFANFSPQHLLSLRPSHASAAAIKSLRAQVRNYTYIYQAVLSLRPQILSPRVLTFSNFVWALSVVMTRQNALPISEPPTMALVPLWDLCNHEPGHYTTQVLVHESITVECRAMRSFKAGDPVTIFYGPRPNEKLLLFSGFVHPDNAYDTIPVSLPISRSDPLSPLKARALSKMGVDVQLATVSTPTSEEGVGKSWLCNVVVGRGVIGEALAVARVLAMDKGALTDWLKRGAYLPERAAVDSSAEEDAKAQVAEAVRSKLRLYNSLQEDGNESPNALHNRTAEVRELLLSEKRLLELDLEVLQREEDDEQSNVLCVEDVDQCHCCDAYRPA
ncbi:Histone-lysine N-methyltransferase setd3 [Gracilariopsis chorda]|uniref:protein-histidine N-methyltransferase n=1 Tax=Gracilariopsis chorda TaxID=448386 RepID=A0A2V3IZ56_9FLOR|nr:Histone-lysine N-methyltransferase setd3 [Gracilariopsis chorda]|eukprot:PXF47428.1 Histone-lysine N-methyltransferase setd3 [Gracilariopsis chorda]